MTPPAVLIVEDSPHLQKTLCLLLQVWNYPAKAVDTLRDALTCLATGDWDIVLLDWNLPESTGNEALNAFDRIVNAPPIVVMSGESAELIENNVHGTAVKGVLLKPFDQQELHHAIEQALR